MPKVRAIHSVLRNPNHNIAATGDFDSDDNMIFRAVPDIHMPGDEFDVDDAQEFRFLIENGAVEPVAEGSI